MTTTIAWANDVSVVVKGGGLVVKGDDDGNTLTIDGTGLGADSVNVVPDGGTTINGLAGTQLFTGLAVGGLKITLGDGNDTLTILHFNPTGKIAIGGGKGSDELTIAESTIHGATKIDAGAGDNAVNICSATFDSAVAVKTGKGTGTQVTGGCPGTSTNTVDASVVVIDASALGGRLAVKAANGRNAGAFLHSTGAGNVSFTNMAFTTFCYSTIGGSFTLKGAQVTSGSGKIQCIGGAHVASAQGNTALAMSDAVIPGGFVAKFGPGADAAVVTGGTIGGTTSLQLGAGDNFVFIGAITLENLTVKGGKIRDRFSAVDTTTVSGDVTIKYGDGPNVVSLEQTTLIGGYLTIKTGKGDDTITQAAATVGGERTIDAGKGANTVN